MAQSDIAEHGLVEVRDELERQVPDDLLYERCSVHDRHIAIGLNQLPVVHHTDRPAHANSPYADSAHDPVKWALGRASDVSEDHGQTVDSSRQLRVVGEGNVDASPDRWTLLAAINAMADSAAEALTKVSQLITAATDSLKDMGIDESQLRTQNLLLHDHFDQTHQRVTARVASYELEATTTSVDTLSSVVSSLSVVLGDNLQIRGFRPAVSNPEPLYQEAQTQGVASSRTKAEKLADSSDVTLGPIQSIEEQRMLGAQVQPASNTAFRAMSGPVAIPPMPIEPGVLSIRAFVTIVYEIE